MQWQPGDISCRSEKRVIRREMLTKSRSRDCAPACAGTRRQTNRSHVAQHSTSRRLGRMAAPASAERCSQQQSQALRRLVRVLRLSCPHHQLLLPEAPRSSAREPPAAGTGSVHSAAQCSPAAATVWPSPEVRCFAIVTCVRGVDEWGSASPHWKARQRARAMLSLSLPPNCI